MKRANEDSAVLLWLVSVQCKSLDASFVSFNAADITNEAWKSKISDLKSDNFGHLKTIDLFLEALLKRLFVDIKKGEA